jgi:hypothetical protein
MFQSAKMSADEADHLNFLNSLHHNTDMSRYLAFVILKLENCSTGRLLERRQEIRKACMLINYLLFTWSWQTLPA